MIRKMLCFLLCESPWMGCLRDEEISYGIAQLFANMRGLCGGWMVSIDLLAHKSVRMSLKRTRRSLLVASGFFQETTAYWERVGIRPATIDQNPLGATMTTSNNWSEDEVTLALVLYLSRSFGKLRSTNPDVEHLAALLGRTPGAVSRKLGNLGFCDNTLRERGIKGLPNVSKVDVLTWEKYVGSERGKKPLGPLLADASMIAADRDIDIDFLFDETTTKKEMPLASGRLVLRKERRSQQFFREVILAGYGGRCAISGLRVPELTEAAHIIPWAEREDCRLLPSNGIALNTLLHRAYDADLLGIDENCRVYVSKPLLKGAKDSKLQAFFGSSGVCVG